MTNKIPVLYSFRRCPYAMRARLAIASSGNKVELREVVLRDKPESMLQCSPKGTVPVLVLPDGSVIEESLDIMLWALRQSDPDQLLLGGSAPCGQLFIDQNDGEFKANLDKYKYAQRHPEPAEFYRAEGAKFLKDLDDRLSDTPYLCGDRPMFTDYAIFPFVRQFAHVDRDWFDNTDYKNLQTWLKGLLDDNLFETIMVKHGQWREGDAPILFP